MICEVLTIAVLVDALSQRISVGILTGGMFVNGRPLHISFQRKVGYVQQQDLHLETTTVREALQFSAMLHQPKSVPRAEKFEYVQQIITLLGMEVFADAVVGVPGEGLNVEQRKLLSIAVEMVAKPELLLCEFACSTLRKFLKCPKLILILYSS
jgi:ATP-binding cassette subfamily G (WHITE) protein 2 (PDR)